jgi:hypothetical protein
MNGSQGMSENLESLIQAGVIVTPLWEVYADVVTNLPTNEVEALVSVKQKLDDAAREAGREPAEYAFNLGIII